MDHHTSMRRGIPAAWLLCLALSAAASAEGPRFDGRGWTVGNQQKNARQVMTEYVLPGQTVDTWKELVTSTTFYQAVPVAAFVDRLHATMSQGCPSLVWHVVQQDDKTAIIEWHDDGCGGFAATSEIDRVTIANNALYRLAYAVKMKGSLAAARRTEWLDILGRMPPAEGTLAAASAPAAAAPRPSTPAVPAASVKTYTTDDLVAGVRRSGWTCPAGVKSEMKGQMAGPQGPLTQWVLECSDGKRYSVLIDPSGSMTSFQSPQ